MPGKYAPWMHLEHYLAPLPWAAKGLRRLVRQDPAVPLLPVGAKLVCQAVARKRITPVDLLHGALSRKDVVSLYRTPEGTYFCDRRRYSPTLVDFYRIETKHCSDLAEVDAFFGHGWRSKHNVITPTPNRREGEWK